ncbi:MAG: redox-sensing transcriptional repressor Rex [Phycisphaerae bacterium]|jgi:redox-sensing transcriptional repressor
MIPVRIVERLCAYRRHLRRWLDQGRARIYSHELASLHNVTPVLVRRDLMTIGFTGSPARGYDVAGLIARIDELLDPADNEAIVLVGLGYLGRAILKYLSRVHPELPVVAAFDVAPEKVGRIIDGCRCYSASEMEDILRAGPVSVAVVAVPIDAAQDTADRLVRAGVRGLLNFTPVRLHVPPDVFVEDVDIAASLEKLVFFTRPTAKPAESRE